MDLDEALNGIDEHLWSSEPDVGLFLSALVRMHRFANAVEVGVFKGFTACRLIDALGAEARYVGIDIEDHRSDTAKKYMAEKGQILQLGDSKILLAGLETNSADLIFLDGDHTLGYVKDEFHESLRILRRGGFICIHDYHSRGVRIWVDYVKRWSRYETLVLNTSENRGLAVIRSRDGRNAAGLFFDLWFAITRNDFALRVYDKAKSLRPRR